MEPTRPTPSYWRRLVHRWLVEYNPLYLLSAAFVLGGVVLISRGVARDSSESTQLAVAGIAELYACALIGGAALLTRIGLTRPAVMLGLLAVLYQGDLTLHTETSVFLGWAGTLGAAAWVAIFVAKLRALAWALRLRASPSALAIPSLGAFGLALIPRVFHGQLGMSGVTAVWLFLLLGLALSDSLRIESERSLDEWGKKVLSRSLRASWGILGLLLFGHVLFWFLQFSVDLSVLLPVVFLLATRRLRSEAAVWACVVFTLVFVAVDLPDHLSVTALMVALALLLRAWRKPTLLAAEPAPVDRGPYRVRPEPPEPARASLVFVVAGRAEALRMVHGSIFAAYLALLTRACPRGAWPEHSLWLDLALGVVVVGVCFASKRFGALAGLGAVYLDALGRAGLIPVPASRLEWGLAFVGAGFLLLFGSLVASYFWREPAAGLTPAEPRPPAS